MSPAAARSGRLADVVPRALPWLALACAAAFAYGRVVTLDPYPSLRSTAGPTEDFFFAPQGGSPYLLLALTALLIHHRREGLADALGRPAAWGFAALLGVPAVALYVWAHYVGATDLTVLSLSLMLLAAGAWLGGRRGLRVLVLPSLFLLLLLPLPGVLLNAIVFPMQLVTAHVTNAVVSLLGYRTAMSGDQLLTTTGLFHVIETCSGLRITETLTMSGILYAELFHRNRRQTLILIASGPLVGVLVNQIRVASMVVNPLSYLSSVHTAQGVAMLVVGVLAIAGIDRVLAWLDPRVEPRVSSTRLAADRSTASTSWSDYRARFVALVALLVGLGTTSWLVPAWAPPPSTAKPLYQLPSVIGEWRAGGAEMPESFLGSVRFSESIHRVYESEDGEIDVFIAADDRTDRFVSLRSDKTLVFGEGRFVEDTLPTPEAFGPGGEHPLPLAATSSTRAVLRGWRERVLVQLWYVSVESLPVETIRAWLGFDRSALRREDRAFVIRVATPIDPGASGERAAAARLDAFLPQFFRALERIAPDEVSR